MATVTTTGIWTSVSAALAQLQGLNTSQVSWGLMPPRRFNPAQRQSGYQFDGVTGTTVLLDGTEFKLGTFTHKNFPITGIPQRFSVSLKVTLTFDTGGLQREFNFTFEHNETPNVPGPVADEVLLPSLQSQEKVTIDGTEYAVYISGFRQGGKVVNKFISDEDRANSADIIAKLVAVAKPVEPPPPPEKVVEPPPPPEKVVEPPPPPEKVVEEQCRVKQVVSVSTVFSAVLERLNRRSVVQVLEQVIAEVNKHCEQGPGTIINIDATRQQIEILNAKLLLIQQSARELDEKELAQLRELLKKLLLDLDLSKVIQNIQINIDGRTFDLRRVVEVLATVDQVVKITIQYKDSDAGDISGVIFVLTDNTQITFRVRAVDPQGGKQITYVFETGDWKGLPAEFSLVFSRRSRKYELCGQAVTLESFDGVEQTNIVFDLCSKIGRIPQKD